MEIQMSKKANWILAVSLPVLGLMLGCGGGAAAVSTLEQDAYAQVEGLGDAAGDQAMFEEAFVAGAAPKNRSEYASRGYEVVGEPVIEGDNATLKVKIFGGVFETGGSDSGKGGKDTGEVEQTWTLQRSGEAWKIKDAPLG
ncbi:hypothetical protein FF011L_52780 [Roseimaritima multifibrata]|uniref:DUF4878 domain-containing protein n=2 Tax=Roseimaritima multifibrata TaxID=1930274 RepID=A0A517MNW0_9BACT|nr:hypothetical protein FF011L_52780 [Roseimaritima multifibrata]